MLPKTKKKQTKKKKNKKTNKTKNKSKNGYFLLNTLYNLWEIY